MFIFFYCEQAVWAYSGQVRLFWGGIIVFSSFFAGVKREFSGYNAAKLVKDILAGLTVCAVALRSRSRSAFRPALPPRRVLLRPSSPVS